MLDDLGALSVFGWNEMGSRGKTEKENNQFKFSSLKGGYKFCEKAKRLKMRVAFSANIMR